MTATYTKPTKVPRWADTSVNVLEPAEPKKDEGWLFEEIPPSAYDNWLGRTIGEWFKWLDERFFDGTTKNELLLKSPESAVSALRISDTFVTSEIPFKVKTGGVERAYIDASLADFSSLSIRTTGDFQFTPTDYLSLEGVNIDTFTGGVARTRVSSNGLEIAKGLQVGSFGTPVDNDIHADGEIHAGGLIRSNGAMVNGYVLPTLNGDSGQFLGSAAHRWYSAHINTITAMTVGATTVNATTVNATTVNATGSVVTEALRWKNQFVAGIADYITISDAQVLGDGALKITICSGINAWYLYALPTGMHFVYS